MSLKIERGCLGCRIFALKSPKKAKLLAAIMIVVAVVLLGCAIASPKLFVHNVTSKALGLGIPGALALCVGTFLIRAIFKASTATYLDQEEMKELSDDEVAMTTNYEWALYDHNLLRIAPENHLLRRFPEALRFEASGTAQNLEMLNRNGFEDMALIDQNERYIFLGVFDCHGGTRFGTYCKTNFVHTFLHNRSTSRSVVRTFEHTVFTLHNRYAGERVGGVKCAISVVDKKSARVYTATLSDCEAYIYRGGEALALSPLRDWSHQEEKERAQTCGRAVMDKGQWQLPEVDGYPFSRSIGDWAAGDLISHRPVVTMHELRRGDHLVIATNGVWDFVPYETALIDHCLNERDSLSKVTKILAYTSMQEGDRARDNAAVIVLKAS